MSRTSVFQRVSAFVLCAALAGGLVAAGCGGGGGGGLSNDDPGDNDVNVVIAFGDSVTAGESHPSYPEILDSEITLMPDVYKEVIGEEMYNSIMEEAQNGQGTEN